MGAVLLFYAIAVDFEGCHRRQTIRVVLLSTYGVSATYSFFMPHRNPFQRLTDGRPDDTHRAFRFCRGSRDAYLAAALTLATSGTTPSCCIRPRASQFTQPSTILPFERRATVTPEMLI